MKRNELFLYYSQMDAALKKIYKILIYQFLLELNTNYPAFFLWYQTLFVQDELKAGREIAVVVVDNQIAAVSIWKVSAAERKICTLKVGRSFQRRGYGRMLMEAAFEYLGTARPFFTVDSKSVRQFTDLFLYYGFYVAEEKRNYYGLLKTELVYNGFLSGQNFWMNKLNIKGHDEKNYDVSFSGIF